MIKSVDRVGQDTDAKQMSTDRLLQKVDHRSSSFYLGGHDPGAEHLNVTWPRVARPLGILFSSYKPITIDWPLAQRSALGQRSTVIRQVTRRIRSRGMTA